VLFAFGKRKENGEDDRSEGCFRICLNFHKCIIYPIRIYPQVEYS
jgi:hypothetical protein